MNYTEEEKKAIEDLKKLKKECIEKYKVELDEKDKRIFFLENEARKIIEQDLDKAKVDLYENYISKEVIREKIKEIEDSLKEDCIALHEFQRLAKIDILKEILGE